MRTDLFPPTSRYFGIETTPLMRGDGNEIPYLKRRWVPGSDRFVVVGIHVVTEGERLDRLAAKFIGDAEQFWRLCDANDAMRPDALTERIGRRLRITLPEGIPGPSSA